MREQNKITRCNKERVGAVIDDPKNLDNSGRFMYQAEGGKYVACDNRTEDAWVEEFEDEETAIAWLNDEFEMSDYLDEKAEERRIKEDTERLEKEIGEMK